MTTTVERPPAAPGTIDAAELRSSADSVRILDVRARSEYDSSHIAGSYHVPLDTLREHCNDICGVEGEVVLVCQSGGRATQAAELLASRGMTNLRILDGGMTSWTASGGDVVRGPEKWALERQVRLVAGSIALGSILASTKVPTAKWVAGGIGAGLTFAALSNTCAMGNLLGRLPYNRGSKADVEAAIDALVSNRPAPAAA